MTGSELIVGLDIGSSKVTVVVAESNLDGEIEIFGIGTAPSSGIRNGVVINIESTRASVADAVAAAERISECGIRSVVAGISGSHIESLISSGIEPVSGKGREITEDDVRRVLQAAKAISIPMDREMLHVIPRGFIVDDQRGIKDPIDMIGVRLQVEAHIITGSVTAKQNLLKCIDRAGLDIRQVYFNSIAAAETVLTQEEKELGVIFVDIGGGTSNVLVYTDGAPCHTFVLPRGGQQVTKDISFMLKISLDEAEKIKCNSGSAYLPFADGDVVIVPGVGGKPPVQCTPEQVCLIIRERMAEIFKGILENINRHSLLNRITGGLVLTGGGALLPGVVELAQDVFNLGARIGTPARLNGLLSNYQSPEYSTAVGLIMHYHTMEEPFETMKGMKKKRWEIFSWLRSFFE